MEFLNKFKKGQALPLNTIVIAILVVIVLLVIIVFFTGSVGESGDQLDQNSASNCNINNPVLSTLGYTESDLKPINVGEDSGDVCGDNYKNAIGVKNCCVLIK